MSKGLFILLLGGLLFLLLGILVGSSTSKYSIDTNECETRYYVVTSKSYGTKYVYLRDIETGEVRSKRFHFRTELHRYQIGDTIQLEKCY